MRKENHDVTILLAEDDPFVLRYMAGYLGKQGYRTITTDNGSHALELFVEHDPDILLTDLDMPGLDGLQLLEAVRARASDKPIILVSGVGTMEDVIEAIRLGAWDYVTKPIHDPTLLLHAVERALERSYLLDKVSRYQEELEQTVARRTAELSRRTSQVEQEIRERRAAEAAILHAKKEWEHTADSMDYFVALIDRQFRIVRVNRTLSNTLGMKPEEMIGMHCCTALHGRSEPLADCPHARVFADRKPHTMELHEQRLGGHIHYTVSPYYDPDDNTLIGSVLVGRNINREKQLEEEKKAFQSQLLHAQKLESVGRLAAGIAHEINTPVQFVGTNIDFLQECFTDMALLVEQLQTLLAGVREDRVTPELVHAAEQCLEEVDWDYLQEEIPQAINQSRDGVARVSSIVRAMKEFSHPASRKKTGANINRIIETTVTVARNEWKYVADVDLQLAEDLPQIPCLVDEMGQVILNLLVNAAHAIAGKLGKNPDGAKGTITIRTLVRDEQVEIRITDTGTGMPPEIHEKVFDPFFTTKEVGRGTGQGLTIAHDVVCDKHGGTLTFESMHGQGTTFIIRLPLQ